MSSSPPGINCESTVGPGGTRSQAGTCTAPFAGTVTLTATPLPVSQVQGVGYADSAEQSVFTGWGGACSGVQPTCTVTMDQARNVTASFGFSP